MSNVIDLKMAFLMLQWMIVVCTKSMYVFLCLFSHCHFVADAKEIPYHAKFLLIASFLASYNLAKTDKRYFSEVRIKVYTLLCHVAFYLLNTAERNKGKTKS